MTEQPVRELRPPGALLLAVIHFLTFFVLGAIGQSASGDAPLGIVFIVGAQVIAALVALYVGLVRYAPREPTAAALGFVAPDRAAWRTIALGVLFAVLVSPVVYVLSTALAAERSAEQTEAVRDALAAPGALLIAVVANAVIIPLVEEALYRGFVQPRLVRVLGVGRGIALAVLLYSISQVAPSPLLVLLLAAPLGIIAHAARTTWAPVATRIATAAALIGIDLAPYAPTWPAAIAAGVAAAGVVVLIWRGRRPD